MRPLLLLLESLSYRGVGNVDLIVDRAGGGKLFPGVGCVQVPPDVCERLRDSEVSVFQAHHLEREGKRSSLRGTVSKASCG